MQELQDSDEIDDFMLVNSGEIIDLNRYNEKSVNIKNYGGWTLLMYACNRGHEEQVRQLIDKGANVRERSIDGKTALMIAAAVGDEPLAKWLVAKDQLELSDDRGWTALFYAVFYGREDLVKFLLGQGSNVQAMDNLGRTPIKLAVQSGMDNMVSILLKAETEQTPVLPPKITIANRPDVPARTPSKKICLVSELFKSRRTFTPNSKRSVAPDDKENVTPNKKIMIAHPSAASSPPSYVSPIRRVPLQEIQATTSPRNTKLKTPTVLEFLIELQMEKYWPIFRDEEVDFETLMTFDAENLNEIGINLYGPRRKIAMAIKEYQSLHGKESTLLKNPLWGPRA